VAPGGGHVANQVVGDGAIDIILLASQVYVDLLWDEPRIERFLRRIASCGRLILFDRRGTGASDRVPWRHDRFAMSILDAGAEDLLVVLDAVGSSSAALVGSHAGAKPAILFAAVEIASTGLLNGPIGALVRITPGASQHTTVAGDLFAPYGVALTDVAAYVTTCAVCVGGGEVIKIPLD
jgi:pimeloyl-ACP methyl ester carboxylesterase